MMKSILKAFGRQCWIAITSLSINIWFVVLFLIFSTLTRLALVWMNLSQIRDSILVIPVSLGIGVIYDLFIALCLTSPLVLAMLVLPVRLRSLSIVRWIISAAGFVFIFGNLYLGIAEMFFFEEFSSRFNYVAVDYLIYPHEIFVNIMDTYPVIQVLIGSGLLALALTWLGRKKLYSGLQAYPRKFSSRIGLVLLYGLLIAAMSFGLNVNLARSFDNRVLSEIALNGVYTFFYAGFTNELDYDLYYRCEDERQAYARLRRVVGSPESSFLYDDSSETIDRVVYSNRQSHRFNIVLVLEESLGSNFIGTLNPNGPCLTPRFDSLSAEGMIFSHIYATGNRTVRGLEAALLSFPPIPGRSVVKRTGCEHLFALPSLLKGFDYSCVFLYGGLSYFDNFGHFAASNGFDRVFDETDLDDPVFSTIWGVSDEDLFGYSLNVFDSLAAEDKPFFATLVTVSNHKPFTYPKGRIPQDPEQRTRENAVRYADYAIGDFIDKARSHSYFDSTVFVFLADHGARVYGSERVPMQSYQIPILFYCPALIPEGTNVAICGSQLDLSPTLLDFLGFNYTSMFFGQSLLSTTDETARALMSHNRDVSLLKGDTLAVLGIQGTEELWHVDESGSFQLVARNEDSPLIDDAIAYYMTAYNMFKNHRLHPLNQKLIDR